MNDEDIIVNPSLVEYLRRDFGIVLPSSRTRKATKYKSFFA